MTILLIVASAVAVAALAAFVVMLILWRRARRRLVALERRLRGTSPDGTTWNSRVDTAGRVVRSVARQASRVREQGVSQALTSSIDELLQWATADRERIKRFDPDAPLTVFFSDIADSTATNERLGDHDWVRVLADHDRLVRREIERRGGEVVKSIGDGFMAIFGRAEPGVLAALDIQRALGDARSRHLRRTPLSVRIGLHSGTAIKTGADYLGRNVALSARIASHARGGQVLVSADTRSAASHSNALVFRSEGRVAFKGVTDETEVFSVELAAQ